MAELTTKPTNSRTGEATLLNAVAATGAGSSFGTRDIIKGVIQVSGTFVGTVKIEGSQDGTNFTQIGSDITTVSSAQITDYYPFTRANVSAYTSGNITVKYSGISQS